MCCRLFCIPRVSVHARGISPRQIPSSAEMLGRWCAGFSLVGSLFSLTSITSEKVRAKRKKSCRIRRAQDWLAAGELFTLASSRVRASAYLCIKNQPRAPQVSSFRGVVVVSAGNKRLGAAFAVKSPMVSTDYRSVVVLPFARRRPCQMSSALRGRHQVGCNSRSPAASWRPIIGLTWAMSLEMCPPCRSVARSVSIHKGQAGRRIARSCGRSSPVRKSAFRC